MGLLFINWVFPYRCCGSRRARKSRLQKKWEWETSQQVATDARSRPPCVFRSMPISGSGARRSPIMGRSRSLFRPDESIGTALYPLSAWPIPVTRSRTLFSARRTPGATCARQGFPEEGRQPRRASWHQTMAPARTKKCAPHPPVSQIDGASVGRRRTSTLSDHRSLPASGSWICSPHFGQDR